LGRAVAYLEVPCRGPGRAEHAVPDEPAVRDLYVPVPAGVELGDRDLRGLRTVRVRVEQREPERAVGLRARALVHRVADPDSERLGWMRCTQVVALVEARRRLDVREAGASWVLHPARNPK